jgi:nitrile hydratase accessory protein
MSNTAPSPVFEAPWHAEAFAIAVALNEAGLFEWPVWAEAFGAELAARGADRDLNGGDDYFIAWVATLEKVVGEHAGVGSAELDQMFMAWREAYLHTPHGQPVKLAT